MRAKTKASLGESKRFFERWRTLPERIGATLMASEQRAGAGFATVSGS
jgi:hypothetical protein